MIVSTGPVSGWQFWPLHSQFYRCRDNNQGLQNGTAFWHQLGHSPPDLLGYFTHSYGILYGKVVGSHISGPGKTWDQRLSCFVSIGTTRNVQTGCNNFGVNQAIPHPIFFKPLEVQKRHVTQARAAWCQSGQLGRSKGDGTLVTSWPFSTWLA